MGIFTKDTGPRMKRADRKRAQSELKEKKAVLSDEISNLERVSELNEELTFDYQKPKKASTLGVLRYHSLYEDGLCEVCSNVYSFTVAFSNITYQLAGEEEQTRIFTKYCELLNYFPHTVNVQLTIRNYYRDNDAFLKALKCPWAANMTNTRMRLTICWPTRPRRETTA